MTHKFHSSKTQYLTVILFMCGSNWLRGDLNCALFRVEPVQQINKLKQNEHAQILRK